MSASNEGGEEGDWRDFDQTGDGAGGGEGVEVGLRVDCQEVSKGKWVGLIERSGTNETTGVEPPVDLAVLLLNQGGTEERVRGCREGVGWRVGGRV